MELKFQNLLEKQDYATSVPGRDRSDGTTTRSGPRAISPRRDPRYCVAAQSAGCKALLALLISIAFPPFASACRHARTLVGRLLTAVRKEHLSPLFGSTLHFR
jgi:hypothetical protein